jgi:hypothetical protein
VSVSACAATCRWAKSRRTHVFSPVKACPLIPRPVSMWFQPLHRVEIRLPSGRHREVLSLRLPTGLPVATKHKHQSAWNLKLAVGAVICSASWLINWLN